MTTATQFGATTATGGTSKFKILAADKLAKQGLEWIQSQADAELVNKPGLSEEELAKIVGEHDAMIVRSGVTVTAKVLENPGRLKVIARAGVGVDNIDLEAATAKGILVVNTAEASTITTAEHAFALMMSLARNIGPAYKTMSEGGWDRNKFQGRQLSGKTLGVVGLGRIGQAVAERALVFGMTVIGYDPFVASDTIMDGKVKVVRNFKDLVPQCDILTFHVPLTDDTRGLLNNETFKLAKKGLMVVNAARGGVVDEDALLEACESGQCGGAALDVYTKEPPAADSALRKHPKILVTPHLGASTEEAQQAVSVDAASACMAYLRGEGIHGAVNAGGVRVDLNPTQRAFVDLAERMAQLISPMVTRGIAQVNVEVGGKQLGPATGTIERTILVGLLKGHLDVPLNVISVGRVAEQRGIKTRTASVEKTAGAVPELVLEIQGPPGAVDADTVTAERVRRIVGRVYDDLKPRIVEINHYPMDMIPAGPMLLIQNEDRPGMVGLVGNELGEAKVNIADMAISRRKSDGKSTALMVLKLDNDAPDALLESLKARPGIIKVAKVKLAAETA